MSGAMASHSIIIHLEYCMSSGTISISNNIIIIIMMIASLISPQHGARGSLVLFADDPTIA